MEIKKFNSLDELLLSEEFKKKDLSYCDLSGINLSSLPEESWENFTFDHTNFSDTGIKFYPETLHPNYKEYRTTPYYSVEYCDFTNCDLSYLKSLDIAFTSIKGSNFTNTGLEVELYTGFGKDINYYWEDLGYKDYSDVTFPNNEKMYETIKKIGFLVNFETIMKNPNIPFSSESFYSIIKKQLPSNNDFLTSKKIKELNSFIDDMLKEDEKREGKLKEFLDILTKNNYFSEIERIRFFQNGLIEKKFSDVDFSSIPSGLISLVPFNNCSFDKITFPEHFESHYKYWNFYDNSILKAYFPTITTDSWRNLKETRLSNSRITLYRNLYLELGRFCNGKCEFCRNQYLEPCNYDLEGIKNSLLGIGEHLDNVVVGGGEPTLLSEDIYYLKEKFLEHSISNVNWTIFTNASVGLDKLIVIGKDFDLNISRHSLSDSTNNKILGVNSLNTCELTRLRQSMYNKITLCATCFKGEGLDTVEKLEDYLTFSDDLNISSVMFQTLHKDLDSEIPMPVLPIEDEIFDEMIIKLKEQGYEIGIPIYSTADYKLITAKKLDKTISFKKYISKEELEKEWYMACKRTFDLSMDPSGNVYENWHQSSGKVLLKR